MARTVNQIKAQLYAELANQQTLGNLTDLTSPSMSALYKTWFFIQAVTIAFFEQMLDVFTTNFETKTTQVAWRTPLWIQAQAFKFQYGDVLSIDTNLLNLYYPVIDPTKQIINACSVVISPNGVTNIKVATGSPLGQLSSPQAVAFTGYISTVLGSGVQINIVNDAADVLVVNGIVFVNGQDPNVQTNVINALLSYMSLIPFNGTVKLTDIEETIRAVNTVLDWQPSAVSITPSGGTTTYLINTVSGVTTYYARNFPTVAGYVVSDGNLGITLTFQVTTS